MRRIHLLSVRFMICIYIVQGFFSVICTAVVGMPSKGISYYSTCIGRTIHYDPFLEENGKWIVVAWWLVF